MTVTTIEQKVLVTGVTGITITEPVLDEGSGDYVREVRVMTGTDGAPPQTFTLRLAGETAQDIAVTAPEQEF